MKNKDTIWKRFNCQLNELDILKEYLENMALKGWILKGIKANHYLLNKCEPKKITYSVEVFDGTSNTNISLDDQIDEYINYCEAAGWNFICSQDKVYVFSTDKDDIVPIESDINLKLKTIHKSMLRRNNYNWFGLLFYSMLFLISGGIGIIDIFSHDLIFSSIIIWFMLLLINSYDMTKYFLWYYKSKKLIKQGKNIVFKGHKKRIEHILYISLSVIILFYIVRILNIMNLWWFSLIIIGTVVIILSSFFIEEHLIIKIKSPIAFNNILVLLRGVIIGSIICSIIIFAIIIEDNNRFNKNKNEPLPLTFCDLEINHEVINSDYKNCGSFLIVLDHAEEYDNFENRIDYYIYTVKNDWIYVKTVKELENHTLFEYKKLTNATAFGANTVYCDNRFEGSNNFDYLLLYDDRIIQLSVNFKLSNRQMNIIHDKLGS